MSASIGLRTKYVSGVFKVEKINISNLDVNCGGKTLYVIFTMTTANSSYYSNGDTVECKAVVPNSGTSHIFSAVDTSITCSKDDFSTSFALLNIRTSDFSNTLGFRVTG
jgi:hypothetical protein